MSSPLDAHTSAAKLVVRLPWFRVHAVSPITTGLQWREEPWRMDVQGAWVNDRPKLWCSCPSETSCATN
uniref:Uncharacterized protein n=1 Tax=Physcomitrium patens TaxID=3218 RepID=A0A2K1KIP9_PHYPA|nr:hypothetical protein PHYPA_007324 [Physcomitrium patens]